MHILSNVEFERLTANQSFRLRTVAKRRLDRDPSGFLCLEDLPEYIKTCTYSGDHQSASWLKSLATLAQNGQLSRMRRGTESYQDRQQYNKTLHANGAIKYKLNDSVQCKESGRFGQVVDYLPETKEYVVILDPFQVKVCKEAELVKVG